MMDVVLDKLRSIWKVDDNNSFFNIKINELIIEISRRFYQSKN
jgi:hypothetical protein